MARRKPSFTVKAVTVICTDRWRSDRFYTEVLGAVVLPQDEPTCRWYRLGDCTLTLVPNAGGSSPAEFGEHPMNMLFLEADDLEAAEAHFAHHQVEVIQESDGETMMIADPDGLPIEVWQRESLSDDEESGE
jgi:catechol-2,3-dioxygenase